jgi:hypothetical protein
MDQPRQKLDPNLSRLFACLLMWEETGDPCALIEALGHVRPRLPSRLERALVGVLEAARYNDKGEPRQVTEQHADRERHAVRWMYVGHFKKPAVTWDEAVARTVDELEGHWAAADFDGVWKSYKKVKADLKKGRIHLYQIWRDRHLAPVEPKARNGITEREGLAILKAKAAARRARGD